MNGNQNNNDNGSKRSNNISRGSLLDDQFKVSDTNKLFLCTEKNCDETAKIPKHKLNTKKPHFDKSILKKFSNEKYKAFLDKIENSNEEINNMDVESIRIDKDILNVPDDSNHNTCVIMDVSMGIFDMCNENLSDSKLKDMNITVSEIDNQEPDKQGVKELIQEI